MAYDCPHCSKPIDGAMSVETHLKEKAAIKAKLDEANKSIAENDKVILEKDKAIKAAEPLREQLAALTEKVERAERTEATRAAGLPTTPSHLRMLAAEHAAYVEEAKGADPKAEPLSYAAWLADETGAKANEAVKGWFGAPASGQPNPANPSAPNPAVMPKAKPPPPPKPADPAASPNRARTPDEINAMISADPLYQKYSAAAMTGTPQERRAAGEAAFARLSELQRTGMEPAATP